MRKMLNLALYFLESSPSLGKMDGIAFESSKPSFPMVGKQVSTDAT